MKRRVFLLIIALWPAYCSFAQQEKALNIAVIADKTGGLDKSPLLSLLEAQLSNNKNIKLIERAQIDKILQEQQLSAAGLLERNNTIKVGQLLRADAFIILSHENQTEKVGDLIRVRLAQTSHGLRLLDYFEQIEASKPDEVAKRITKRIESVMVKLSLPAGAVVPVGIVDIHRVQLGDKYRILERALPMLLSVRLGIEPKIIMLEREDLKILQDEKLRTSGEDSKFWGSGVLIEGNLQPKDGGLIVSFSLRRVGEGSKSFSIPIDPNEPSAAVDKAAKEIVQDILNAPPTGQWQLAAEAEQFYQQGQLLANHSRYEEALLLFETAHALKPDNVIYTGSNFERIWDIRYKIELIVMRNESDIKRREEWQKNNPQEKLAPLKLEQPGVCPYSDIEIVEMASLLVSQIRNGYEKGLLSASEMSSWSNTLGNDLMSCSGYLVSNVSVSTEQIKNINQKNRKIWVQIFSSALRKQPLRKDYPQMNNLLLARLAWLSSDDPNELMNNLKKAFNEFIMPPSLGGTIRYDSERKHVYEQAFDVSKFGPTFSSQSLRRYTYLNNCADIFPKLWVEYVTTLPDINDPVLSAIDKSAHTRLFAITSNKTERDKVIKEDYKKLEDLFIKLKNTDNTLDDKAKKQLIANIKSLLEVSIYTDSESQRRLIWEEICEFLIKEKDIDSLIEIGVISPVVGGNLDFFIKAEQRRYHLLERIAEVLQSHKDEIRVKTILNRIDDERAQIRRHYPDLNLSKAISSFPVKMLMTKEKLLQNMQNIQNSSIGKFKIEIKDGIIWMGFVSGNFNVLSDRNYRSETDYRQIPLWGLGGGVSRSVPIDNICLAGFNLAQNKLTTFWQAKVSANFNAFLALILSREANYLCTDQGVIIELPGTDKEGWQYFDNIKVYAEDGLPSPFVTSIVKNDDSFWIAYGDSGSESGLGKYEPKTEKWETVFCSTIKGDSPFSQGKPYIIHAMQIVSPNELFFLVYDTDPLAHESKDNLMGLWKMNTKTKELKYFGPVCTSRPDRVSIEYINKQYLFKTWSFISKFDIESGKLTKIIGRASDTSYLRRLYRLKDISLQLEQDLFIPDSVADKIPFGTSYSQGNLDLSTSAIHKNKLWANFGRTQIAIIEKGKSFEEAQIIDNNILDGEPVSRFVSTPYGLIAIGQGTVGLIETEGTQK